MGSKSYGVLVIIMLLTVVTSSLDLPVLGSSLQGFVGTSSKTASSPPQPLHSFMFENVSIHEDGTCDLTILIKLNSSGPLSRLYRHTLGLANLNLSESDRIPINDTIPVPMSINVGPGLNNASLLPGGCTHPEVGNTSIANLSFNNTFANRTETLLTYYENFTQPDITEYNQALNNYVSNATFASYSDTPANTNITRHFYQVKNETWQDITQPVRDQFLNAVIQEQACYLGIHIGSLDNIIDAKMWGLNGECFVKIEANAIMQAVPNGVHIGPLNLNKSLNRAGFILTKIGFIQNMLRNLTETEGQEYTYNNTWTTNFFLPENAILTNLGELEGKSWPTVDFGNGTYMEASIPLASSVNVVLEERMGVTNREITRNEAELLEDGLLCLEVFKIEYHVCCMHASKSAYYESQGVGMLQDDWSWGWSIHLWEANFTLELPIISTGPGVVITDVNMSVYVNMILRGFIGWDYEWFKLEWFRAWMELESTLTVLIEIPAKYEHCFSKNLFVWWSEYWFFIGPIPVVVVLEFKPIATLSVGVKMDAEIVFGVNATGKFRAGVGWKRDGDWEIIYRPTMEVNYILDTHTSSDTFWLWVTPSVQFRLSLLFYGVVGPFVELEPYVKFTAHVASSWFWWFDVGVNINAGIEFQDILKKILRISDFKWNIWNKVLWSTLPLEDYDMMLTNVRVPKPSREATNARAVVGEDIFVCLDVLNIGTLEEFVNVTVDWNSQVQENCSKEWTPQRRLKRGEWLTFNFTLSTQNMENGTYPVTVMANDTSADPDATPNDNNCTVMVDLFVQNVTIHGVTTNATNVIAGQHVRIDASVTNTGTANVSVVPVSAYYETGGTLYAISEIWCEHTLWVFNLTAGASANLTFIWNTMGVAADTYNIIAYAWPLPYESRTDDNTGQGGQVQVTSAYLRDIAVKSVAPSKTIVCQDYTLSIYVTVKNEGNIIETFYVIACANTCVIGNQNGTINPGESKILTFTWSAKDVAKGNYTIKAEAIPVLGEIDLDDNSYTDGTVRVIMVGDLNGDGKVTISDIVTIALAFGTKPGEPNWNADADINNDKKVTITDIVIAALNFGQTDP